MEQGRIKQMGAAHDVIAAYQQAAAVFPSVELVARYQGPADDNMYIGRLLRLGEEVRAEIAKKRPRSLGDACFDSGPAFAGEAPLRCRRVGPSAVSQQSLLVEAKDDDLHEGTVGLRSSQAGGSFERFAARG